VRPPLITLLLATRNAHKVREIRAILGGQFQFLSLDDFPGAPEVVENASTFAGNAGLKALALVRWIRSRRASGALVTYVLADDSGLEVDVLGGAPGVHSARFAAAETGTAGNAPTAANNAKLLHLLKDVPPEQRTARFRCVVALAPLAGTQGQAGAPSAGVADESELELFEGSCEGRIILEPRGPRGFGYDPLFVPDGHERTFAELDEDTKNRLSHRARAVAKMKERLEQIDRDDKRLRRLP